MKRKFTIILAELLLLSACNRAENTAESTTIAPEMTTAAPETTTEVFTKLTTAATAENDDKIYKFSCDFAALSELGEDNIAILEKSFYGTWRRSDEADMSINMTYCESPFSFTNSYYPCGVYENNDIYYMAVINGGVAECYITEKNKPDVMYYTYYDFDIEGVRLDEVIAAYERVSHKENKTLNTGNLGYFGELKLFAENDGFSDVYCTLLSEDFIDENGIEYTRSSSLDFPREKRFLVTYTHDKIDVALRFFNKAEFDSYTEAAGMGESIEPAEKYFILSFDKTDGKWVFSGRRSYNNRYFC